MDVDGVTYEVNKPIFGDNFVIFSGRYTDFTPEFYKTVGTTLVSHYIQYFYPLNLDLPL